MKTRRPFDLVVIGAEPAGLAAAACAARQGARVALIRAGEPKARPPSNPGIPDFVWRRLDLQDSGLAAKPVAARISLFEDGRTISTYASQKRTRDALEHAGVADHHLWTDFKEALDRQWEESDALTRRGASSTGKNGAATALAAIEGPRGPEIAARLTASTRALLDDYFANDDLKTHLATIALLPLGLGGDEAGSGLALAALSSPAAWRIRTRARGPSLARVLEDGAKAAGVEIIDARIRGIGASDDKYRTIELTGGEVVKAKRIMAASEAAAARADIPLARALAPSARRSGAVADIRLRFAKTPPPPAGDKNAIFYIAESIGSLGDARDAALEGRLPDRPPISFEYSKDEIIVHAPYCPSVLLTEGEEREWTEQDRQAFGRQIVERLAPYLNGAATTVKRVEVKVTQAGAEQGDLKVGAVVAPSPGHDVIGAAAQLALDLISGE